MEILNKLLEHPAIFAMVCIIIILTLAVTLYALIRGKGFKLKTIIGEVSTEKEGGHSEKSSSGAKTDVNINIGTSVSAPEVSSTQNKEISNSAFSNSTENIDNIMRDSVNEILDIKTKFIEENRKTQARILENALQTIVLSYSNKTKDDEEGKKIDLLELYLMKDFNSIMRQELDDLRKSAENGFLKREDFQQNIPSHTDHIIQSLDIAARKFKLIDDKTEIISLLNDNRSAIKDTFERIITQFITLSEKEQTEKLNILNKQKDKIDRELKVLLERT
jgi:hypothetical protein